MIKKQCLSKKVFSLFVISLLIVSMMVIYVQQAQATTGTYGLTTIGANSDSQGWGTAKGSKITYSGTDYWLIFMGQSDYLYSYDTGITHGLVNQGTGDYQFTDPYVEGSNQNRNMSIYATITDGKLTNITVYTARSGEGIMNGKVALYSDVEGVCTALLNQSSNVQISNVSSWVNFDIQYTLEESSPETPAIREGYLCLGDSITYGNSMVTTTYPQTLATLIGNTTLNAGVSGEDTTEILARWDTLKTGNYASLILLGGINDILDGTPVATIKNNLYTMWSQANSSSYNMSVYAVTLMPFKGWNTWDAAKQANLEEVNNWIRFNATATGYTVVEAYNYFNNGSDYMLPQYVNADGLHPNQNGTDALAQLIYDTITDQLPEPTPTPTPTATPTATEVSVIPETNAILALVVLVVLLVLCLILCLVGRGALLTFVFGVLTLAVGAVSLSVEGLPFKPYFNLVVLLVGVLTMFMASRFRSD